MGNQPSQDGKEEAGNNKTDKDIVMSLENMSSFKGIKTEGSEKHCKHTSSQTSAKTTERNNQLNDSKVMFTFEWKEGGNWVLITGSFINWGQNFTMQKNDNGVFTLPIEVNRGVHQFKFIVDNKWRCSQHYTTIKDGSDNTNNIIDLTDFNSDQPQEGITPSLKPTLPRPPPHQSKTEYPSNMPSSTEMNTDCPQVPLHYQKMYNIDYNTKQDIVGDSNYLNYCERNLLSENNSYKKVLVTPHVNLNHHCSKFLSMDGSVKYCKIIRACVSQRIKHKFVTVIYYNKHK